MTLEEIIKLSKGNEIDIVLQTEDYIVFEYEWCRYAYIVNNQHFGTFYQDNKEIAKLIAQDAIASIYKQHYENVIENGKENASRKTRIKTPRKEGIKKERKVGRKK